MQLDDFIVLIPCVAALIVGFLLKKAIPTIPERFIPLICAVLGLAVNIWVNMSINPGIFVEGLISGIAATGMFSMVKSFIAEKKEGDKE